MTPFASCFASRQVLAPLLSAWHNAVDGSGSTRSLPPQAALARQVLLAALLESVHAVTALHLDCRLHATTSGDMGYSSGWERLHDGVLAPLQPPRDVPLMHALELAVASTTASAVPTHLAYADTESSAQLHSMAVQVATQRLVLLQSAAVAGRTAVPPAVLEAVQRLSTFVVQHGTAALMPSAAAPSSALIPVLATAAPHAGAEELRTFVRWLVSPTLQQAQRTALLGDATLYEIPAIRDLCTLSMGCGFVTVGSALCSYRTPPRCA